MLENINRYIEHTLLKPTATVAEIEEIIEEAIEYQFLGICVPPFWVKKVSRDLEKFDTRIVTVIGFPLGFNMTETKVTEIETAIENGADELDLVMNISAFKSGIPWTKVELAKCAQLVHDNSRIIKVIIETAYLEEDEIIAAAMLVKDAGGDYVKTSTGYAPEGAKVEHVRLLRKILPSNVGIKASGGIKTRELAIKLIEAGADRIGTSAGPVLMKNDG